MELRIHIEREERTYPARLVLDKSFFHDAFRTDYAENKTAKWLFPYLINRRALDKSRQVCVTASIILDRFAREFKTFPNIPSQTILAIRSITSVRPMPDDVEINYAPVYLAKMLYDSEIIPIVVSSVKLEKWRDRAQKAGITLGLEEFTELMSERRVMENLWFAPISSANCVKLLNSIDPLFREVVELTGEPPEG